MRAFLYEFDNSTGRDRLGTDHATVTKEYKSFATLWRYAIHPFAKAHGNCHAYIYYNWAMSGKHDKEITYNPAIFKA